jgi:hypothetical protein
MACRLDDQNKLTLISISIPQNCVIIWDLAEQLKFPRKHFRHQILNKELKFNNIFSMSQRKGEYLMFSENNIFKFRLPRRYQKLREILYLQENSEINMNLQKYLSTAGKDNIQQICSRINNEGVNLESMDPLDLFTFSDFSAILIQDLDSEEIESFGSLLKDVDFGDFREEMVIDEPFNEDMVISKGESIFWVNKLNLNILGEFNFGFGIRDSGLLVSKMEKYFWILLGKI